MADQDTGGQRPGGVEDAFKDVRGGETEGSLMGPATVAICCAVCCGCAFLSLIIALFVWAGITLATSESVTSTACGASYPIYAFCIAFLVIIPIMTLILYCIVQYTREHSDLNWLNAIPSILNLAILIWGAIIWASITPSCEVEFTSGYYDLYLLFKIVVVLWIVAVVMSMCMMCAMLFFLAGARSQQGGLFDDAGYQRMPGQGPPGGAGGANEEALRNAARDGQIDEVARLLGMNTDVNSADPTNGYTALHYAASNGKLEVTQRLVNAKANIDAEANNGDTPLRVSAPHPEVERFLRGLGARDSMASAGPAATQEYV